MAGLLGAAAVPQALIDIGDSIAAALLSHTRILPRLHAYDRQQLKIAYTGGLTVSTILQAAAGVTHVIFYNRQIFQSVLKVLRYQR